MLGVAMHTTIKTLMEKGLNKAQVAKATGHDWKTVSKVMENLKKNKAFPEKKSYFRILDPHKEQIVQFMEQGLTGVRIHQKLLSMGVAAGYTTVKTYIASIRKREKIFVRIHTKPAEEAQVDFGYVGLTSDNTGKKRRTWVFNMKLCYSRLDHYQKVYDQRVETFIQCHINAFEYFGGVPEYVRIDNLKAAILEASFYEPVYQRLYRNFADYYGFKPIPCRIYRPNDKGKVESGIKYVKYNFFAGRTFINGDNLDKRLKDWRDNICNKRIHGTTRKAPLEVFMQDEKTKLKPLPLDRFKMIQAGTRNVYHDCHIHADYNYYSVPFEYVGKEVAIELSESLLKVYYDNKEIAVHPRQKGKGSFSTQDNHYPKYKRYSETEYQEKYQTKMKEIGRYAEQLFFLAIQKQPRDWGRTIQGVLSLLKSYPCYIVESACKRALAFGVHHYSVIKNICANGSYALPVEFNMEEI